MSRDGSGTYTLPSGNPVVTGTVISSSVHNATMTDLETEMTNSTDKDGQTVITGTWDFNSNKIILDLDGDTSVTADTDDQVDWEIGGTDLIKWVDGIYQYSDTDAGSAIGPILKIYRNSASPADADFIGALYFDGEDSAGNQDTFASLETQIDDVTSTTEDGTLLIKTMAAGTLTTQFDISSAGITITPSVTMTGDSTALTYTATGDSSAGDNATLAYTSAEGAILTGQGSTSDITLKNDADATIMDVATGTLIAAFKGGVTIADDLTMAEGALAITDTANEIALTVTSSATTASSVKFASASQTSGRVIQATDIDALTTGSISYFISNSSNAGTRTISHFENQHASAINATVVEVKQGAAERALFVNQDANGIGIEIDSEATTEACFRITAPAITTGNCIQVTDANALTSGSIVFVGSNNASFSGELINATVDNPSATGTVATFKNDGTGNCVFINQDGNAPGLIVDGESTSTNCVEVRADASTTGDGLFITSDSADTGTRSVLNAVQDNSLATGAKVFSIRQDSTATAVFIDHDANGVALNIDSEATTANAIDIRTDAQTTGNSFLLLSDSADTGTRNLMALVQENSLATGARCLNIRQDSTATAVLIDGNGNGVALNIDSEATTANVVDIRTDAQTTGNSFLISSDSADTGTRNVMALVQENSSASGAKVLNIRQDSVADGVFIDQNGNGAALNIDSESTSFPPIVTASVAISTNFERHAKFGALTIWISDGTTAEGALTGVAGDICLNGGTGAGQAAYCDANGTNWTDM